MVHGRKQFMTLIRFKQNFLTFLIVYKYFKTITMFKILATVCFNVDGQFRRQGQFVSYNQFNSNQINLLNLITIFQWYTEINRKQKRYLKHKRILISVLRDNFCFMYRHELSLTTICVGLFENVTNKMRLDLKCSKNKSKSVYFLNQS